MKILYVAALTTGGQGWQRMNVLRSLGHEVTAVDHLSENAWKRSRTLSGRILQKIYGLIDWDHINKQICDIIAEQKFDVIWLSKALLITIDTMHRIKSLQPECKIIGYSGDDQMNPINHSHHFWASLPLYNIFFTTKTFNIPELKALGCRRVEFVGNAYDPAIHRPMTLTDHEKEMFGGPVGFIGGWEKERSDSICYLAESGIDVRIWGYRWNHCKSPPKRLKLEMQELQGQDYARAICAFDINLCFLRKCNRDLQTVRSIEIPACRAFMLAERTKEHLELFEEGKEAEFFDSNKELLEKVKYYLAKPEKRKRIAAGGYERCIKDGCSHQNRLKKCLETAFAE